jgi:hypothetical protein
MSPESCGEPIAFLQKFRGVLGNASMWAAAWSAFGFGVHLVSPVKNLTGVAGSSLLTHGIAFGVLGFLSGSFFSGLLILTERAGHLGELSMIRSAAWGTVAGLVGASATWGAMAAWDMMPLWIFGVTGAGLGLASGGGLSAIAKRSHRGAAEMSNDRDL